MSSSPYYFHLSGELKLLKPCSSRWLCWIDLPLSVMVIPNSFCNFEHKITVLVSFKSYNNPECCRWKKTKKYFSFNKHLTFMKFFFLEHKIDLTFLKKPLGFCTVDDVKRTESRKTLKKNTNTRIIAMSDFSSEKVCKKLWLGQLVAEDIIEVYVLSK